MPDKDNFGAVLQPVGFCWQNNDLGLKQDSVTAALRSSAGNSGFHEMNHPVVLARDNAAHAAVVATVDMQACKGNANVGDGSVSPTLCKPSGNDVHAVAFTRCDNGGDASVEVTPTMRCGSNYSAHPAVAFNWQNGGGYGNANEGLGITIEGTGPIQRCNTPAVAHTMTVRRLTAKECERLQAFPDDYTLIPWRKKPAAECPDGPRYKALGNSMAVNVVTWIGERIQAIDAQTRLQPAPTLDNGGGCDVASPL